MIAAQEKRRYDAVLCDIEGTTTSISFVKNVLFPYCAQHVEEFLERNIDDGSLQSLIKELIADSERLNQEDGQVKIVEDPKDYKTLAENIRYFIGKDLKLTSLKELQGQMWTDGYEREVFKAHVYEDTVHLFEKCYEEKVPVYIYSSGSVLAQKLLFAHTERGNLSQFICDYFDTHFGAKTDPYSYVKIAAHTMFEPKKILFLTDVDREAYAADKAGLSVTIMIRDGNAPLSEECKKDFKTATSFNELKL